MKMETQLIFIRASQVAFHVLRNKHISMQAILFLFQYWKNTSYSRGQRKYKKLFFYRLLEIKKNFYSVERPIDT